MGMKKELLPLIESNLNKMTTTEKKIAAYFLKRNSVGELTTKFFCGQLHVSRASLTRFSNKSGFKKFLYKYRDTMLEQQYLSSYKDRTQNVLLDY